jgi:hypothetical protein
VLLEDEYFAVRVGIGGPVHSIAWIKEQAYTLTPREVGEYAWEVAICRGSLQTGVCEQLAISEQGSFVFYGCVKERYHRLHDRMQTRSSRHNLTSPNSGQAASR